MIKADTIYYSAKAYNQYDIEKFPAANVIVTPYNLTGIFSVGQNLYFNTTSGIVAMPKADPNAVLYLIEPRWNFAEMNTVDRWNNGVIGLTNDGIRYFNGQVFTNYDMSYNIKNYIDQAIKTKTNFYACGYVYRRTIRNEYHLLWQDDTVSDSVNNMHAILNLDTNISSMYGANDQFIAAWEFQPVSGNFVAISRNTNTVFVGQTHATAPKIYKETQDDDMLNYLYDKAGRLITTAEPYQLRILSRIMLPGMNVLCWLDKFRLLLSNNKPVQIRFQLPDQTQDGGGLTDPYVVPAPYGGDARFDVSKYDESYYPIEGAFVYVDKFPDNFNGREIAVEISQLDNDPQLQIMTTQIQHTYEMGNFL
jgi:hypothetical protein